MFYCGLDVALKSSYLYLTDAEGRKKTGGEVATEKAALTARLRPYLRGGLAVALEAGNQSAWLHDLLIEPRGSGHGGEPRQAQADRREPAEDRQDRCPDPVRAATAGWPATPGARFRRRQLGHCVGCSWPGGNW